MKSLFSNSPGHVVGSGLGLLADTVNDASSTRNVYLLAAGLAVLGLALVIITVWFWRSTRHDPELLAPLEIMGARRFRRLENGGQREMLDRLRPADAKPMRWGVRRGSASERPEPEIDLRQTARNAPAGYDDLLDPALIAVAMAQSDDVPASRPPARTMPPAVSFPAALPGAAASIVAPVAASPVAAVATAGDIDSDLATVGAKVEVPDAAETAPAEASPVAAVRAPAVPPSAGSAPVAPVLANDAPTVSPRGDKPGGQPASAQPLVIVPVDHELRTARPTPVLRPAEPAAKPVEDDATAAAERPAPEESTSIDPLLRMLNRNDG